MPRILAVSGSPSATSRTGKVLDLVADRVRARPGYQVEMLRIRDLPAEPLLHLDREHPALRAVIEAVLAADGLIVATPIYQAAYTGAVKVLLDVLPQYALADKVVLPLATGGSRAHVLAIDYALRPVLSALGADHIVPGYFVVDDLITDQPDGRVSLHEEAGTALAAVVTRFVTAVDRRAAHAGL